MSLLISLVDIFLILLLVRLLIRPNEAYFDPIYNLVYRITDPALKASAYVTRSNSGRVFICVAALIILKGLLFSSVSTVSIIYGIGTSLLGFFKLLFQGYFVLWLVSVLSVWSYQTSFEGVINRALHPFNKLSWRLRIKRNYYSAFVLLSLFVLYVVLSALIRFLFFQAVTPMILPYGLLEGCLLVLGLFPFPGFLSLIIIAGALLSWVNPDPSNSIVRAIYGISEPLLQPFRRFIPSLGGFDISPVIALLCFQIIGGAGQQIISNLIRN